MQRRVDAWHDARFDQGAEQINHDDEIAFGRAKPDHALMGNAALRVASNLRVF